MKTFKILYRTVAVLLLVALFACMFINYSKERNSGRYTGATSIMSPSSRQWIIDNFGEYETFDDLLYNGITPFALNNFVYDMEYDFQYPLQSFDFQLFQRCNWRGVCFHYAQWAKTIVLEWSLYKDIDVDCYIFDAVLTSNSRHSYNFFKCNGDTYVVDLTYALTQFNNNLPYDDYIKNLGKIDMYYYAKNVYKDKVYNVY